MLPTWANAPKLGAIHFFLPLHGHEQKNDSISKPTSFVKFCFATHSMHFFGTIREKETRTMSLLDHVIEALNMSPMFVYSSLSHQSLRKRSSTSIVRLTPCPCNRARGLGFDLGVPTSWPLAARAALVILMQPHTLVTERVAVSSSLSLDRQTHVHLCAPYAYCLRLH